MTMRVIKQEKMKIIAGWKKYNTINVQKDEQSKYLN